MKGKVQKCSNEVQDFFHLFDVMAEKLTKRELEQWAVLSGAIWNARNNFYFEKTQAQPKGILEGALAVLETYQRVSATRELLGIVFFIFFGIVIFYCVPAFTETCTV